MSHNNGRIYIDTSVTPNIGISVWEVAYVLGSGADVCRNQKIKPFAKYKPLPIGDMSGYDATAAKVINYGLYVPYYTLLDNMAKDIMAGTYTRATNYDANKAPFEYTRIAATDWSRLLDFNGYNHKSRSPLGTIESLDTKIEVGANPRFSVPLYNTIVGQMLVSDIHPSDGSSILREDMYYGMMFICYNPTVGETYKSYVITNYANTLDTRAADLYYREAFHFLRGLYNEDSVYYVCMFLSSVLGDGAGVVQDDMARTGYFIPLTFTRITPEFVIEKPEMTAQYDSMMPFNPYGSNDYEFVWALYPNGEFYFTGKIEAYGPSLSVVLTTSNFTLHLYKTNDNNDEQIPTFVKIRTNVAGGTATVKTFKQPGITYDNVYDEVYQDEPLLPDYEETVQITSGSLVFPTMHSYAVPGKIGSDQYGYSDWNVVIPN